MQTKATMRYHLTLVRMAKVRQEKTNVGKDVGKRNPSCTVGVSVGAAIMENSIEIPQTIRTRTTK